MTAESTDVAGATIRLEGVRKQYKGQTEPAVAALDVDIVAGEIVAFVGPSGCGKTTTLKMINRLVEPTSGRIYIGGRDVTDENPDTLRQSIGYVIQSGGLFPHWSVERNVGAIPRVLGWDKKKIAERTEELLQLVGLDPQEFGKRLPKDMSGGQQQRVGVARALAADPPVLLMDEPFSAVDPITRVRLQDSLIEIQKKVAKTIVIVTHDFEEATKLGDRVLIFSKGGRIEQFGTPAEILANPANDFVREFIGSGATLAQLSLTRVKDVDLDPVTTATVNDSSEGVVERARAERSSWVVVVDEKRRPRAWPSVDEVASVPIVSAYIDPRLPTVALSSTLNDALDVMLAASQGGALVTDADGGLLGWLRIGRVIDIIRGQLDEAQPDEVSYIEYATSEGGQAGVDDDGGAS
ncbi:ABC transporter ATP-binding protein [Gordonia sp. HY442]|uniref:ABC transporter ATP-binding protein n=1 Tax=Gordonia zhenghanii TaxID=2911516 RepID=UPI001F392F60|nr:ABC transporter ATP-binding protein [Gordonia zhenghanii]MCF8601934.1 ABC transporter ATP-binding protein [Gordonia zhenghanii]MCF8602002.1 ABC transporter ATP-binding protein [Gordonia zhenghanii]